MTQIKVSVILTSYNYGKYIGDAVSSLLCQTFKDFELIIIDDGSTDNSIEIIEGFAKNDDRIRLIRNEKNSGLSKVLEKAVSEAQGEWIAFMESDDILNPDAVAEKLKIAENYPDAGFIYNGVELFGENVQNAEKRFKKIVRRNKKCTIPKNMFYGFGYDNPVITMSSVMVRKKFFDGVDFKSPIDKLTDWYLYVQLAYRTKFLYTENVLTKFRQHNDSYLKSDGRIKFKFANISAYMLIYKQNPFNMKLLGFIAVSIVRMCFKRFFARLGLR